VTTKHVINQVMFVLPV